MGKVDPNEAPEGYVAAKTVDNGCLGCDLDYLSIECCRAACGSTNRKDGCNVIFIKKPDECQKEAVQTGAMAFRFLKNFHLYMQP